MKTCIDCRFFRAASALSGAAPGQGECMNSPPTMMVVFTRNPVGDQVPAFVPVRPAVSQGDYCANFVGHSGPALTREIRPDLT